jgi:hypothetical protein
LAELELFQRRFRVKRLWIVLVVVVAALTADRAYAQGPGVRAGVSGDPDQFYVGVHYETNELLDNLRFRPNVELGVGNDLTLVALNFEFAYRIPLQKTMWDVYLGGGPALNIYHTTGNTDPRGGFNIMIGAQHRKGLFAELKVGLADSPNVKFGVGYAFGK